MLPDFPYSDAHPNAAAHRWLEQRLAPSAAIGPLLIDVLATPHAFQIALLRASIERLPWLREHSQSWSDANGKRGQALYELACQLYKRKLPYSESDVCEILRLSRHSCGHGSDVKPPFDILVTHARRYGVSSELLGALRAFLEGLKGVTSAQAWFLKRKGAVLLLLDTGGRSSGACWSDRFREGLGALPPDELRCWQNLVLDMNISDQHRMSQSWRRTAERFLAELGVEQVVSRLSDWWPDAGQRACWPVATGGGHLLKQFVWLLDAVPENHDAKPACDQLVRRVVLLDWKPLDQSVKFQIAAALYLAARPPAVAREPLQRLGATLDKSDGRIREIVAAYLEKHGRAIH